METSDKLEIRINVLIFTLSISVAFMVVFLLSYIGINVTLFGHFVSSLYLIVVPGALLIIVLRVDKANTVNLLLYTVGLSISSIMLMGLMLNFILPYIGIGKPLSFIPLFVTVTTFFIVLYIFCLLRRKGEATITFQVNRSLIPLAIIFLFPLFLAIFGCYLVYYYGNNVLLLVFLLTIALMVFSSFSKQLSPLYPLIIFVFSLSLVYYAVLSSPYSLAGDTHIEYYQVNTVLKNLYWDPTIANNQNATPILTIFIPIFVLLSKINITLIFKVIFPIIYSLIPLILYQILRAQVGSQTAFLSSYYFSSMYIFFNYTSQFIKQGFAVLFLSLIMLLITDSSLGQAKKNILVVAFSFSIILSHYGTSYLFMLFLIIVFVWLLGINKKKAPLNITYTYVLLYSILTVAWYMYISSGSVFESLVRIGDHIVSNLYDLFNPATAGGLNLLTYTPQRLSSQILKILYLVTQFFILFGFLEVIYCRLKSKKLEDISFNNEYLVFLTPSFLLLFACISIPHLTSGTAYGAIDTARVYTITNIFLAPLCVIGGISCIKKIFRRIKNYRALKILSVFLVIFLLSNSGLMTELIIKDGVGSVSLSQSRVKTSGSIYVKASLYIEYFSEKDVFGALWLSVHKDKNFKIYHDYYALRVLTSYGMTPVELVYPQNILINTTIISENSYIYLREINYIDNILTISHSLDLNWIQNASDTIRSLNSMSKIYSNGGSVIFMS